MAKMLNLLTEKPHGKSGGCQNMITRIFSEKYV